MVLTFDVEPAEERRPAGGRFQPAIGYDLRVWGRFENRDRPLGLPWVLDVLQTYAQRATFFVETLGASHFGEGELAAIVQEILRRGHDVQLHAHPVMKIPTWVSDRIAMMPDDFADYPVAAQIEFLQEGLGVLHRCGVRKDAVIAFRAGNYGANRATWQAMARVGLRMSSNLNQSYLGRNCRIDGCDTANGPFDTATGVWELPITNFREPGGNCRLFQVTAISFAEARWLLMQAHVLRLGVVTMVSHLFEYFFIDSIGRRKGHANHINRVRLMRLLDFLAARRDVFQVSTVADLQSWIDGGHGAPPARFEMPVGRRRDRYPRFVSQAAKRLLSRVPL